MTAILLSVRPRFARALLDGTKKVEIRRRFPGHISGAVAYIYSTKPDCAILGTVYIRRIERILSNEVWHRYQGIIGVGEEAISAYLEGVTTASVLRISKPIKWDTPMPLCVLQDTFDLRPVQSFRYLSDDKHDDLNCWASIRQGSSSWKALNDSALFGP